MIKLKKLILLLPVLWSCSVADVPGDYSDEDVMPLKVTGAAFDASTSAPLKGIRMVFNCFDADDDSFKVPRQTDTVYTNSRGSFAFEMDIVPPGTAGIAYVITASDLDGGDNGGSYQPSMMTLAIDWKQSTIYSEAIQAYLLEGLAFYLVKER